MVDDGGMTAAPRSPSGRRRAWSRRDAGRPSSRRAPRSSADARLPRLVGRARGGRGGPDRSVAGPGSTSRSNAVWRPTGDQLDLVADLLETGVDLERAFSALERTTTSRTTRAGSAAVTERLRAGARLSAALVEVRAPTHLVALAAAGERTGRIAEAIRGAGALTSRIEEARRAVARTLIYPGVVLAIGVLMLVVIATTVVPQLERTFVELGGELPLATRVVLTLSDIIRGPWPVVLAASVVALRHPVRQAFQRSGLRTLVVRMPVVRRMHADLTVTVLARLVSAMLSGGVPFVEALREAGRALEHGDVGRRIEEAASRVERGGSAFDRDALGALIGPAEQEMLAVGERSGLLAAQWARVAERRARSLDDRVARIGAVLEPVLVLVVGGLVGGAVVALYLPTFRILELI